MTLAFYFFIFLFLLHFKSPYLMHLQGRLLPWSMKSKLQSSWLSLLNFSSKSDCRYCFELAIGSYITKLWCKRSMFFSEWSLDLVWLLTIWAIILRWDPRRKQEIVLNGSNNVACYNSHDAIWSRWTKSQFHNCLFDFAWSYGPFVFVWEWVFAFFKCTNLVIRTWNIWLPTYLKIDWFNFLSIIWS